MCTVCGCGNPDKPGKEGEHSHDHAHDHQHDHDHGHHHHHDHEHGHDHSHAHSHGADGTIDFGAGPAGVHVAGLSQERIVRIEQDIFAKNDAYAADNRRYFARTRTLVLNLVSSPGAGKTTLLVRAIEDLKEKLPIAVIEGDQQTSNDADRIRETGVAAVQVNTGKGCHLDAHMVGHALDDMPLTPGGVLFIENVGNLVCPAGFDLGEAHKVVILSVTEGEDKPIKYPDMFAVSDLMVINKTDLLPHVDFDVARAVDYARKVNPRIEVVEVSARTGEGLRALTDWITARLVGVAKAAE
ncbi:hydrogenase nickel incorporation protein HypB [Rhodobium orientis]|uniref:Hydrogenase maturation factor HypB n=1 Tax=Rhodobium orientis TaxID=34017 RepID=A0A327JIH2_9HYPH|nr:hydrogenase nickel incorporation protein HypB [Rhodobium orientis]MBB4304422.1 hydrogenase nickel incorporation protein HypB [Rhodobium orientis]MBK5952028.1 hydrogenase accessory protein HypB [Rhodobium orientis]RAI25801.1 hydrogenase accessory protein HypB [Rhodobium orientis]